MSWAFCRMWLPEFYTSFGGVTGGCFAQWRSGYGTWTQIVSKDIRDLEIRCTRYAEENRDKATVRINQVLGDRWPAVVSAAPVKKPAVQKPKRLYGRAFG